jgi:hypothetical protein
MTVHPPGVLLAYDGLNIEAYDFAGKASLIVSRVETGDSCDARLSGDDSVPALSQVGANRSHCAHASYDNSASISHVLLQWSVSQSLPFDP